jgi:hypothetical protein
MEILINELSLNGQFPSVQHFFQDALIPFIAVFKEFDRAKDVILKKQDFWNCYITKTKNLYSLLPEKSVETTRLKLFIRNLGEPFWENNPRHNINDNYEYDGKNINGSSIAESCERDRIVISFIQSDFSKYKLQIAKNQQEIEIDNLFQKEHYIEVAFNRGQIDKCKYFENKIDFGLITLLENECRFTDTQKICRRQNTPVYKEIETGHYWHLDNVHNHYEVYNAAEKHIAVADRRGNLDSSKKVSGRILLYRTC